MYILGINAYHGDAAACIFKDNKILAAAEEERFTRQKHWAGLPIKSIEFCLNSQGLKMSDISSICVGRDPKAKIFNNICTCFRYVF
jgi:carbamoyltransferase